MISEFVSQLNALCRPKKRIASLVNKHSTVEKTELAVARMATSSSSGEAKSRSPSTAVTLFLTLVEYTRSRTFPGSRLVQTSLSTPSDMGSHSLTISYGGGHFRRLSEDQQNGFPPLTFLLLRVRSSDTAMQVSISISYPQMVLFLFYHYQFGSYGGSYRLAPSGAMSMGRYVDQWTSSIFHYDELPSISSKKCPLFWTISLIDNITYTHGPIFFYYIISIF